jgi:hypothetical protein
VSDYEADHKQQIFCNDKVTRLGEYIFSIKTMKEILKMNKVKKFCFQVLAGKYSDTAAQKLRLARWKMVK